MGIPGRTEKRETLTGDRMNQAALMEPAVLSPENYNSAPRDIPSMTGRCRELLRTINEIFEAFEPEIGDGRTE